MSALSRSRSGSSSSSSCLPRTERSVVCASWLVAAIKSATLRIARSGSTMRDRDIVARDHVLRRHVLHHDPQIDLHHLLRERNENDETGPLHPGEATQCEDDAALIFPQ